MAQPQPIEVEGVGSFPSLKLASERLGVAKYAIGRATVLGHGVVKGYRVRRLPRSSAGDRKAEVRQRA